jgi:hypothetical protein
MAHPFNPSAPDRTTLVRLQNGRVTETGIDRMNELGDSSRGCEQECRGRGIRGAGAMFRKLQK